MNEGRVERLDGGGGGIDLVLQRLHRPVRLLPHSKYVCELAYFIFDWSEFGVVLRTSDDAELAGTVTARHSLVHICRVMGRQVVPNKNVMVVCPLDPKLLNLHANAMGGGGGGGRRRATGASSQPPREEGRGGRMPPVVAWTIASSSSDATSIASLLLSSSKSKSLLVAPSSTYQMASNPAHETTDPPSNHRPPIPPPLPVVYRL